MTGRRGIFLDRDGTLMADTGYIREPSDVVLVPGATEALRRLRDSGFCLVLVSNQSGIGRGIITEEEAASVHAELERLLAREGTTLDGAYYCPHAPWDGCACRKPAPGLLLQAAQDLGLDLSRSVVVGDKESDVDAGRAAGCVSLLLGADVPEELGEDRSSWGAVVARIEALG